MPPFPSLQRQIQTPDSESSDVELLLGGTRQRSSKNLNLRIGFGLLIFFLGFLTFCYSSFFNPLPKPIVVLISLDGTRPEYLSRGLTPNLQKFMQSGFHAEMIPAFPSITFPNHYSLVTGQLPAQHGIVANTFYDPQLNDTFSYTSRVNNAESKWWLSEPIWTTAQKQYLKAGIAHWPGSEAQHEGIYPTYYKEFHNDITVDEKIGWVKDWVQLPVEKRPRFIAMYLSDIDHAGHEYGPLSKELNDTLVSVDDKLGSLYQFLNTTLIPFDLVIVSDHGMADSNGTIINIDTIHNPNDYYAIFNGPLVFIKPKNINSLEWIYQSFYKEISQGYSVWKREDVPKQFVYNTTRVGEIVLLAHKGNHFTSSNYFGSIYGGPYLPKGDHGYLPNDPDMHSIFIGTGRSFKENVTDDAFKNLQVYALLCHLLGIRPNENEGDPKWLLVFKANFLKPELKK